MRALSLKVISALMVATDREWERVLRNMEAVGVRGAMTHGDTIKQVVKLSRGRAVELDSWIDDPRVSQRKRSMRSGISPGIEWFRDTVATDIERVTRDLSTLRRSDRPQFRLGTEYLTGGPHLIAQMRDGSTKVFLIIPVVTSRKRICAWHMLVQLYARDVLGISANCVVTADLRRKELITSELRPEDERLAIQVINRLVSILGKRSA